MVNFQSDEVQQEREIDSKTREITECFHHAESVLKKFSENSKDPSLSAADKQVRKNMQMSVARKIQALSMSFRSSQKVGTRHTASHMKLYSQHVRHPSIPFDLPDLTPYAAIHVEAAVSEARLGIERIRFLE